MFSVFLAGIAAGGDTFLNPGLPGGFPLFGIGLHFLFPFLLVFSNAGLGMCMIMVWNLMLPGIAVGIAGIVMLLMLIPMFVGLK